MYKLIIAAALVVASSAACEAQTAPQAVGSLVFGFNASSNQKSSVAELRITSSPTSMSAEELSHGKYLNKHVVVIKKSDCNYHILGRRFQNDNWYKIDLDVDFSSMSPSGPTVETRSSNGSSFRYFITNGVKVCNNGDNIQFFEFLPAKGQCADRLETPENPLEFSQESTGMVMTRLANAEKFLQSNFCKGSAF